MHVWAPDTVLQSKIKYILETAQLQYKASATIQPIEKKTGSICCNSTDQAPFFSKWKKCGKGDKGPKRDNVSYTISK